MKQSVSPFKCHLFVCTNTRDGEKKSCGDAGSAAFKAEIKTEISNRGWNGVVRVSESGCLGVCESGPNIMLYPQKIWFSAVSRDDLPALLRIVEEIVNGVA